MKYLKSPKVFESQDQISRICQEFGIDNWSINEMGLVDVSGDVNLESKGLKKLPLKFGSVSGYFDCSYNQLTSLEGAPRSVGSWFDCVNNQLTSLEGAPRSVSGFNCSRNQLTSLEGAPERVGGDFYCYDNQLTSLEGAPKSVEGDFSCEDNPVLTSFDWVPKRLGNFYCDESPIWNIWNLFRDWEELDFFDECDPIRGSSIDLFRLNYFLETIGKKPVRRVSGYKILN